MLEILESTLKTKNTGVRGKKPRPGIAQVFLQTRRAHEESEIL